VKRWCRGCGAEIAEWRWGPFCCDACEAAAVGAEEARAARAREPGDGEPLDFDDCEEAA
jgi:hypothetical protein